jgi:hypothetical protein
MDLELWCGVRGRGRRAGDEGIFQFAVNFRPRESESRPTDRLWGERRMEN